jgi:hypothetical protein
MSLINAVMNMPHHSITPSDANELRYANDAETKIRKIKARGLVRAPPLMRVHGILQKVHPLRSTAPKLSQLMSDDCCSGGRCAGAGVELDTVV